jgi:hypothetical protein
MGARCQRRFPGRRRFLIAEQSSRETLADHRGWRCIVGGSSAAPRRTDRRASKKNVLDTTAESNTSEPVRPERARTSACINAVNRSRPTIAARPRARSAEQKPARADERRRSPLQRGQGGVGQPRDRGAV